MNVLVTGGSGFLGGAIVRMLVVRGDVVCSYSRNSNASLEPLGVEQIQGDLVDAEAVDRAVAGRDVVFHVAAKTGVAGRYDEYHQTNVVGTENVLRACQRHGVSRLVYTSSPSVVFDGRDVLGGDESLPYPQHYHAHYPATKAKAEQMVLSANGPNLATVSLRPHLIWGPRDNNLVPRILDRGRKGRLRRIGRNNPIIDSTYVDNAAEAHLLAAERLAPGSAVAGKAYFISNGEPMPTWDLVDRILAAGRLPPVTKSVPTWMALTAGWILERVYAVCWPNVEPPMTTFVARELATSHWFDLTAARRDLGYEPHVSIEEGLRRLEASL